MKLLYFFYIIEYRSNYMCESVFLSLVTKINIPETHVGENMFIFMFRMSNK